MTAFNAYLNAIEDIRQRKHCKTPPCLSRTNKQFLLKVTTIFLKNAQEVFLKPFKHFFKVLPFLSLFFFIVSKRNQELFIDDVLFL